MNDRTEDEWQALMMGFMDRELDAGEAQAVRDRIARDPAFRAEYESLCRACGRLDRLAYEEPDEAVLRALWRSPYSRAVERTAWALILGGYGVFLAVALVMVLTSDDASWLVKLPILAIAVGTVLLFCQKVRERLLSYARDPYRHIEK